MPKAQQTKALPNQQFIAKVSLMSINLGLLCIFSQSSHQVVTKLSPCGHQVVTKYHHVVTKWSPSGIRHWSQMNNDMISTGKRWLHWPEDTAVQRGVWRDYYSGEKLEDYTKPWMRPRGEGVGNKCASIWTSRPANASWWHGSCTYGNIRGCPCTNEGRQRPLLSQGGNSLGCFTTWGLSLKSVRKY